MLILAAIAVELALTASGAPSLTVDCDGYAKAWKRISSWNDRRAAENLLKDVPEGCRTLRASIAALLAETQERRPAPPSYQARLVRSFKLIAKAKPAPPPSKSPPPSRSPPPPDPNIEMSAWERATALGDNDAYEVYLNQFPDGAHAADAQASLARPFALVVCNKTDDRVRYAQYWTRPGNLNREVRGWQELEPGDCKQIETSTPSVALYGFSSEGRIWRGGRSAGDIELCVSPIDFAYSDLDFCPGIFRRVSFWRYDWKRKTGRVNFE
jgi:uncharacterized membrane protein